MHICRVKIQPLKWHHDNLIGGEHFKLNYQNLYMIYVSSSDFDEKIKINTRLYITIKISKRYMYKKTSHGVSNKKFRCTKVE